ncbi:MAG: PDZ domain-containing protein [Caldisericia bacterium]|nr:PDZ domain-containing protein [Caldisericia bacterium]
MKYCIKKNILIFIVCILIFVLGYGTAIYRYGFNDLPITRFSISTVRNNYLEKVNDETIAKGVVDSLGDPFSSYLTQDELKSFETQISSNYVGIGIIISSIDEKIVIIRVLDNSPAKRAGLEENSEIIKVNGTDVQGKDLESVSALIRGPENTSVILTISKNDTTKDVELKREKVEIETVSGMMINSDVAYIKIYSFNMDTDEEFNKVLDSVIKNQPKGLILDLRNNGGGILEVTENIAKRFLKDGSIFLYVQDRNNEPRPLYIYNTNPINIPIVVIVNKNSASASEVLAGAIRDNNVGKILGERTYGKATIQKIFYSPFSKGAIKLTIQKYLTPNMYDLNKNGLTPDIPFSDLAESSNPKEDKAIKKALELF